MCIRKLWGSDRRILIEWIDEDIRNKRIGWIMGSDVGSINIGFIRACVDIILLVTSF